MLRSFVAPKSSSQVVMCTRRFAGSGIEKRKFSTKFWGIGVCCLGISGIAAYNYEPTYRLFEGTTRLTRSLITGAIVTLDYKYHLRNVEPDSIEEEKLYKQIHERSAKRVLKLCRTNGGLYIKAGQYLASLNHILPAEYVNTLSILQDSAPYQDISMVKRVFQQDFNGSLEDYFAEFDEIPLAAASLAQVHHAVTKEGTEVAVKVQYEQLRGQFDGDVITHKVIFYLLAKFFPGFDFSFANEEMEELLATELDFENEARNSKRAAANLSIPNVYIPRVFDDLSSQRILTCEFIHGCKINDKEGIENLGLDVAKVTKSMISAFSEQIHISGFVHSDPHPGNVFVRKHPDKEGEHQVVILDHGLYRELDEKLRVTWCKLWKAMVEKDDKTIKQCAVELGVDPNSSETLVNMVLMRAHNDSTRVGLGSGMTEEEIKKMSEAAREKMDEFVEILKVVPPAVWLILRNNNLIRSINQDLGVPVNRFLIMARQAVKGIHSEIDENKANLTWSEYISHSVTSVKSKLFFEFRLSMFLFSYWLFDSFISFMIKIGKVKEVELDDLVKAA